jgi:adenylate kinase
VIGRYLRILPGYVLDKSDPDILILRRDDGSFVAAFSVRGADASEIRKAAREDQRERYQAKLLRVGA